MKGLDFVSALGYLVGVAGAVVMIFSKVKNENLRDLKERVEILEKERAEAQSQHIINQKAISVLEGKLESYKEIPLQAISDSLVKLATSNEQILVTLQATSKINAEDQDVLTNSNKHIATEVHKVMREEK